MYITADIGATKMRIAGSRDLLAFDEPTIVPTPSDYHSAIDILIKNVALHASGKKIDGMVVGIAGVISGRNKMLARMPHLPKWEGSFLMQDLEAALQTSVHLENDTALVGLGEATRGAGQGASIVVYITVSTGVNGVRIVEGNIDRSKFGFEIGGQYLSMDPMRTLEDCVSGSAVELRAGRHPRDIAKDDPIWEELARELAFGVHNTILHWSPERVVLGGSMFNDVGISVPRVSEHVQEIMRKFVEIPEIVHASLADVGGLYGGLECLKQVQLRSL